MSIDNIFKCCKKNYILTGVSGIFLGAYGSYYGLSSFLGPIYEVPIEVPPNPPPPVSGGEIIAEPINEPPIIVPLGDAKSAADLFIAANAIGAVALIGGLAVVTYGASRFITSRETFETVNVLRNNAIDLNQTIGDKNIVIKNLQSQLKELQEKNFPQPKKEDFDKIEEKVSNEDLEKMQDENLRLREDIRKLLDKIDNSKKKSSLAGFNFFGGLKTVHFVKPEVKTSGAFELSEEGEKEEIMDIKARQEIIVATNQVLAKAESNGLAIITTPLFEQYTKNIEDLGDGRFIENTKEIAINQQAVADLFTTLGFKKDVTIRQLLTEDVNVIQENMALRLATTAYTDLNTFIYYGARTLAGTPYIKIEPGEILYRIANMQMLWLPKNKIGYLNLPKASVLLNISDTKNFVNKLTYQFKDYIIPIFARLTAVGLARFDPELARMLYVVANNAYGKQGSIKIISVPKFGGKTFFTQFLQWQLSSSVGGKKKEELLEDPGLIKENLAKEGLTSGEWENLMEIPRIKLEFEHVYKVMINMMDRRDAYVDFIKIYNEIYKFIHLEEYNKALNLN